MSKEVSVLSGSPQRFRDLRFNVRNSVMNGAYGTMATGIVSTFVPLYMLDALHANNQLIALLNSLPALSALLASIAGAFWVPRLAGYRLFSVVTFLLTRISYLVMALVPWISPAAATLVVEVNAAANFPQTLATLSWQALMAKLVPSALRENFFGRRNAIITIVGLGGTILTGGVLQLFNPHAKGPYEAFLVLAFLLGLVEVRYLARHREPPLGERPRPLRWDTWTQLWRVASFRQYVIMAAFFNFGWQLSWPLFSIFQINTAHATGLWIGIFTIATQATEILTFRWWGKLAQRYGGLTILGVSAIGVSLVPLLTVLSTNMLYLTAVSLFSGLSLSGVTLLLFTELLNAAPTHERSGAIAFYNVILGGVAFVAPELGVFLLHILHMQGAMLTSTIWRFAGGLFFITPVIKRSRRGKKEQAA